MLLRNTPRSLSLTAREIDTKRSLSLAAREIDTKPCQLPPHFIPAEPKIQKEGQNSRLTSTCEGDKVVSAHSLQNDILYSKSQVAGRDIKVTHWQSTGKDCRWREVKEKFCTTHGEARM